MSHHLPIACTLNAADFAQRETLIARLGSDALLSTSRDATRAELRFAAGEGIRERVDAFVAGESACCAFLTFDVVQRDDEIVVAIAAPADGALALAELVDAFGPAPQAA
jgi:hypothetical protein